MTCDIGACDLCHQRTLRSAHCAAQRRRAGAVGRSAWSCLCRGHILLAPPPRGPHQGPHLSVQLRSVWQQCLGEMLWVPGLGVEGLPRKPTRVRGTPPQGFSIRFSYSAYGLPGGAAVKNPPTGARDRRRGLSPWVGRALGRVWLPTPVFLPREPHGQRGLAGHCPWGHRAGTAEHTHDPWSPRAQAAAGSQD